MARKNSQDIFRQNIPSVFKRESNYYKLLFGAGEVLPIVKIDRGDCESFLPPMVEYETEPLLAHCYWERSDDFALSGQFSYRLTKTSRTGLRAFVLLTADATGLHGFIPGNTYRFGCFLRVSDENVNRVHIAMTDDGGSTQTSPQSGFIGEWQYLEVRHTVDANATYVHVGIFTSQEMEADEIVYADDFELVVESEIRANHFGGGSVYNEVELARLVSRYFTEAIGVQRGEGDELTYAANRFIELRRGLLEDEDDADFLNRFNSLVVARTNHRRTTRWAILDSLSYFIEPSRIEIVERFDIENNKFRVKYITFESEFVAGSITRSFFLDNSFLNNAYLSSPMQREARTLNPNANAILRRVKAAGVLVDTFDVDRRRISIQSGVGYSLVVTANQSPVSRAGADQMGIVAGSTVNLDGSTSSDPDGTISTYAWTQTAGDTVVLTGASTATPSFTAPSTNSSQTLTFQLTVTDNDGATNTDTVDIAVNAYVNMSPIARAGADQMGIVASATVNLDGSTSSDPDGTIASYAWSQISGDTVSLTGASTSTPSFTAPSTDSTQTLTFQLTVTDDDGATDSDTIDVGVNAYVNMAPVARAGSDQNVAAGASVSLDGSTSSDPDGTISTYAWSQVSGTTVTLTNANTSIASFTAPSESSQQTLVFRLTVTDDDGATHVDDITITVAANQNPVARAGSDQSDIAAGATVNLDGSASSDPDGTISTYVWTQTSGDTVTLMGASTSTPSFTAPTTDSAQTLTFQLTVTDDDGATNSDTIDISVNAYVNMEPVARAGSDQNVGAGVTVTLDGSSSSDPDGTIATYVWTQISGNTVVLMNANTSIATFTAPSTNAQQVVAFRLTVTDDDGATHMDDVSVTVAANQLPVARAGADQMGIVASATVNLDGSTSSDPDGTISTYSWTQTAGDTVSLTGANTSTPSFTAPSTDSAQTLTFQLTVTDNNGATNSDTVDIAVLARLSLPDPSDRALDFGVALSGTLPAAAGGKDTITYTVFGLPTGGNFNTATRVLSGNISVIGTFTVTYTATDSVTSVSQTFDIVVSSIQASAPNSFAATNGNTESVLSWVAPSSLGGVSLVRYETRHREQGGSWPATWTDRGTDLTATITGLTNGTTYDFEVRAVTSFGNGVSASTTATPTAGLSARAGVDQTGIVAGATVNLDGSTSQVPAGGRIVAWDWTQTAGDIVALIGNQDERTVFGNNSGNINEVRGNPFRTLDISEDVMQYGTASFPDNYGFSVHNGEAWLISYSVGMTLPRILRIADFTNPTTGHTFYNLPVTITRAEGIAINPVDESVWFIQNNDIYEVTDITTDPVTVVIRYTFPLGSGPSAIDFGSISLWVLKFNGDLFEFADLSVLSPASRGRVAYTENRESIHGLSVGERAVLVIDARRYVVMSTDLADVGNNITVAQLSSSVTGSTPRGLYSMYDPSKESFEVPSSASPQTLTFQLEVTDDQGDTSTDTIDITVEAPAAPTLSDIDSTGLDIVAQWLVDVGVTVGSDVYWSHSDFAPAVGTLVADAATDREVGLGTSISTISRFRVVDADSDVRLHDNPDTAQLSTSLANDNVPDLYVQTAAGRVQCAYVAAGGNFARFNPDTASTIIDDIVDGERVILFLANPS